MTRRSAGTSEQKHTYGSETYRTEKAASRLVDADVSTPDEVNVGGEATVAVNINNAASFLSVTDDDYCAAGSTPLFGGKNGYELDVRVEIQEGSDFVTTQGILPEARLNPGGGSGGGSGNPAVTTTACVPALGEREEVFKVQTEQEGEIRGTVTLTGRGSGNQADSESFRIIVVGEDQRADRDTGGDDSSDREQDRDRDRSRDRDRNRNRNRNDQSNDENGNNQNDKNNDEESGLTAFWNNRSEGEKVALGLGGAGFLAVLAGR
jgi:hypothetical protein